MLTCQNSLFQLDPDVTYLNNAYRGPILKSSEEAAIEDLKKMRNPFSQNPEDFFTTVNSVKALFSQMVGSSADDIALIPSTSYGFACALSNWNNARGKNAITVRDEFPSGYFSLKRWAEENDSQLVIIDPDPEANNPGKSWNERLLEAINEETGVVLISSVHWMNGVKFDLKAIGERCQEVGACFVVDGTQSVGAMPIDVKEFKIDALICASYKWLLGPYSLAISYFSDKFKDGKPLEESWMNRTNSHIFSELTNYQEEFLPGANRFNVGETSYFVLLPMLEKALEQLSEWTAYGIQEYAGSLKKELIDFQQVRGLDLEFGPFSANHLFALPLPEGINPKEIKANLDAQKVFVSVRGQSLRVSINVFNDKSDIDRLKEVLYSVD
ncbi:aminotransferase class V-fold PLP-dependent enzyme [Algoriphagus sediminis]|uniref:Aminotransferase class V-fold PLP-dependent enzyme n=1 Tax=Algoriphagus sediminis TaxID=3057113 RepID=A0ABT7YAT2_9BACT|nr:aminotransferase class V-fold PLP-dependent enzyme [Algoriphagus sediminis]MDN3203309.1 aminotransferase class V-fold PLP-dependent enzyme [Algoriphagus sediminis]